MPAQALDICNLESGLFHSHDNIADARQLAIREDVVIHKSGQRSALPAVLTGDTMIEKQPAPLEYALYSAKI